MTQRLTTDGRRHTTAAQHNHTTAAQPHYRSTTRRPKRYRGLDFGGQLVGSDILSHIPRAVDVHGHGKQRRSQVKGEGKAVEVAVAELQFAEERVKVTV